MDTLVSVIIPVYNGEKFLEPCLDSVLGQTWRSLEILLVDDGSTDSSRELLQRYAAGDPRVQLMFRNHQGVSSARNAAMAAAKGEYITFCDCDDVMAPGAVEETLRNIEASGADIACFRLERFDEHPEEVFSPEKNTRILTGDEMYYAVLTDPDCRGYPCNKMFRASAIPGSASFPTDIAILEDEYFVLQTLAACRSMVLSDAVRYAYRKNPNSARSQPLSPRKLSLITARERILDLVRRDSKDVRCGQAAWNHLMDSYAVWYKKLLLSRADFAPEWRKKIRRGFRLRWGWYRLDDSLSLKVKIYCCLLWGASHLPG